MISKSISELELWKEFGPIGDEGEIDQRHLNLLGFYRYLFFSIKESKILPKPVKYLPGSLVRNSKVRKDYGCKK